MTIKNIILFVLIASIFTNQSCKNKQQKSQDVVQISDKIDEPVESIHQNDEVPNKNIVFFGNSLTAGYGLDEEYSFPSLIQKRLDSLHLPYHVINAGLSGETTADGKSRVSWILKQPIDVFVLELGANDVLRGQDLRQTEANLRSILMSVKQRYPDAKLILAGMQAPANMGNDYTRAFAAIYPKLAKEFKAALIPFLLEDVATIPTLNLADGKHPNAEGQKVVVENVWKILKKVL